MYYKNISLSQKEFYGVKFKPGEVKELNGFVNDVQMIVIDKKVESEPKSTKKVHTADLVDEPSKKPNAKEEKSDGTDSN